MSDTTQRRNTDAHIKGTGEFNFWPNLTAWADRNNIGSIDLGNVQVTGFKPEVEVLEHEGSYRGEKLVDLTLATKGKLTYTLKFDEFGRETAKLMLGGADATDITQGALTAHTCDTLGFTANHGAKNRWYDILHAGDPVREITTLNIGSAAPQACVASNADEKITDSAHGLANGIAVVINGDTVPTGLSKNQRYFVVNKETDWFQLSLTRGGSVVTFSADGTNVTYQVVLVEAEDFIVDYRLGRVRFLATRESDLYPVVDCAAIVADDEANLKGMTPLNSLVTEGYGRIAIFDSRFPDRVAFLHEGFACQLRAEAGADFDGKKISEFDLSVAVDASDVGTMYLGEE